MSDWEERPEWPEHWQGWKGGHWRRGHRRWHGRRRRQRFLFFRFATLFGMMVLLVLAGMAGVALLLTNYFGGREPTAFVVWIAGCCLSVALPLMAGFIAVRTFRGIATPLADVMAAADAVAEGDFSVRVEVEEYRRGEFAQLARSFNRMAGELERAEQQRRNLTADIAHELRTPLHIIQGNLEGVLDGVYQPSEEHINTTLDETRLLARLVEDLRTLSLAEAGQLPLVLEPVDIGELLADVQTSFSGQAEAAEIDLTLSTNGQQIGQVKGMIVSGDIGRLDQVMTNLVANAIRHTPTGGTITLSAEAVSDGVEIRVQDTGEGIDPADLPYIFDRFWRADRARPHSDGAVGLGLAIARQFIRAHSGKIEVESQPGQGTTFTIQLPRGKINPVV
jgi:two-component system OmpR family sensor kinase/two-component system sensor histidine kinase BaeS